MKLITNVATQKMFKRAHVNENKMKRLLPRWIQQQTATWDIQWNVRHIIDTGILESRKSPYICGSPDGIARLHAHGNLQRECAVTSSEGVRCGLECKTMSTAHTAGEQEMLLGNGLDTVKYIDVMQGGDGITSGANPNFYLYVRYLPRFVLRCTT